MVMNDSRNLRAALVLCAALAAPGMLSAAVEEIPLTTESAAARLAYAAGMAAFDRGDAAEANALFHAAVKADPGFTFGWVRIGNVAFSNEELQESITRGATNAGRASEGERLMLAINQKALDGDALGQLELGKQLVQKYPNSPRAWLVFQALQAGLNQFADQRRSLERILAIDPGFWPAHFILGGSYLFSEPKDFVKAEAAYRAAIALAPGVDALYWSLGDVYRGTNRLEEARQFYELALTLDPRDGTSPVKLGHVKSFLGQYDDARKDYDRGIEVAAPANAAFLASYKQFTYVYAGDPARAVRELEAVVPAIARLGVSEGQRSGAQVFALTNAALVALFSGLHDDAARVLSARAAIQRSQVKNVNTPAFEKLQEANIAFWDAQLAAWKGDYKQALALAKKNAELVADTQNPRKLEPYYEVVGLIELRQKHWKKAVVALRQADLTQLHVQYQLAEALDGAGQKAEAQKLFKDISTNNFNTADFALVRDAARKRAG
jgi:tetratricopeptide (TPR) repeat protein